MPIYCFCESHALLTVCCKALTEKQTLHWGSEPFLQNNDGRGEQRERQSFNKQEDRQRSTSRSSFNKALIGQILGQTLTRGAAKWHGQGAHTSRQLECQTDSSNRMILLVWKEWITGLSWGSYILLWPHVYGLPIRLNECFTANCNTGSDILTSWQKTIHTLHLLAAPY